MTYSVAKIRNYASYSLLFISVLFINACNTKIPNKIEVVKDSSGTKLLVNGDDFFIKGMNWDYYPVGTNYSYHLWEQPEQYIQTALEREMTMLKELGINTIRVYDGIPPRWIKYIYEKYGIYTVLNHSFGRYGLMIDNKYIANTDYSDRKTQVLLMREIHGFAEKYKDTPGLLMWLIGNENNYGLFWEGAESEDIPAGENIESIRARALYKLFNKAVKVIKQHDKSHPVAICNGDLLFMDLLVQEVSEMDILGVNVYRGVSFTDLFEKVKGKVDVPLLLTEFGADAFNAVEMKEDQAMQAKYFKGNWKEIFLNAYGHGAGNAVGGMAFQFSDGWWKFDQEKNLDVHDTHASWSNGGYSEDFVAGKNNMNEEWFGICSKGTPDESGYYKIYPRAAYYAIKHALTVNPLSGSDDTAIREHFGSVSLEQFVQQAVENAKSIKK